MKILVLMVSVLVVSAMSNLGSKSLQQSGVIAEVKQCGSVEWDSCLWNDKDDVKAYSQCLDWVTSCMNKLGSADEYDIKEYL